MTALARSRMHSQLIFTYLRLTLASGNVAFKNGMAALDLSTGKVEPGHAEGDLFLIGRFDEDKDASAADALVNVNFGREVVCDWWENGSSITSADIGKLAYILDDQTVTLTPGASGAPVAGRIWQVSATQGVAVEKLPYVVGGEGPSILSAFPAFVSNDSVLTLALLIPNAIYDVPTTGAASTITLPAGAPEGTKIYGRADGTKNGHTTQYRDATGPVNLTAALTASKRHLVVLAFNGGIWTANAAVSP